MRRCPASQETFSRSGDINLGLAVSARPGVASFTMFLSGDQFIDMICGRDDFRGRGSTGRSFNHCH
jgi:hypothetical protein